MKVEEFPLLMPKIKPHQAESYLCTPIRMDTDATYYIVGFKPNATKMTAHHMLIYGCEEPGRIKSKVNVHGHLGFVLFCYLIIFFLIHPVKSIENDIIHLIVKLSFEFKSSICH